MILTKDEMQSHLQDSAASLARLIGEAEEIFGWKITVNRDILSPHGLRLQIKETLLDWKGGS